MSPSSMSAPAPAIAPCTGKVLPKKITNWWQQNFPPNGWNWRARRVSPVGPCEQEAGPRNGRRPSIRNPRNTMAPKNHPARPGTWAVMKGPETQVPGSLETEICPEQRAEADSPITPSGGIPKGRPKTIPANCGSKGPGLQKAHRNPKFSPGAPKGYSAGAHRRENLNSPRGAKICAPGGRCIHPPSPKNSLGAIKLRHLFCLHKELSSPGR